MSDHDDENDFSPEEEEKIRAAGNSFPEAFRAFVEEAGFLWDHRRLARAVKAAHTGRAAEHLVTPLDLIREADRARVYKAVEVEWRRITEAAPAVPFPWTMDHVLTVYWRLVWAAGKGWQQTS